MLATLHHTSPEGHCACAQATHDSTHNILGVMQVNKQKKAHAGMSPAEAHIPAPGTPNHLELVSRASNSPSPPRTNQILGASPNVTGLTGELGSSPQTGGIRSPTRQRGGTLQRQHLGNDTGRDLQPTTPPDHNAKRALSYPNEAQGRGGNCPLYRGEVQQQQWNIHQNQMQMQQQLQFNQQHQSLQQEQQQQHRQQQYQQQQ
jgi:hypothetical protein